MNTDRIDAQIEIVNAIIRKNDGTERPLLTEHGVNTLAMLLLILGASKGEAQ